MVAARAWLRGWKASTWRHTSSTLVGNRTTRSPGLAEDRASSTASCSGRVGAGREGASLHQGDDSARLATAAVGPLTEDHLVEDGRRLGAQLADILVATVARDAGDADHPAVDAPHPLDHPAQGADGLRVVGIVHDHPDAADVADVEPPRVLLE